MIFCHVQSWNPQNFLITKNKRLCLIDSDNFQIRLTNGSYLNASAYCRDYLAPELLFDERSWSPFAPGNQRTPAQENWSLAVALYSILLLHHPFKVGENGVFLDGCADENVKNEEFKRRIREGEFAIDVEVFRDTERSLSIMTLPLNIYKGFFTTFFMDVTRPELRLTPGEWLHCFKEGDNGIKECRGPERHLIFANVSGNLCPLCGF
jgi:DNA-binding helix-hairpin-helix protein with protein kinase domain